VTVGGEPVTEKNLDEVKQTGVICFRPKAIGDSDLASFDFEVNSTPR